MSDARVNLNQRNDVIGDVLRQKERLERVSAVLCDGLGERPADYWRGWALNGEIAGLDVIGSRLRAIADLIESENL